MDHSDNPKLYLSILQAELALIDKRAAQKRRKNRGHTRTDAECNALEDIGRLEGAIDSLNRLWNTNDDRIRKATLFLSAVAWDLRKNL